MNGISLAFTGLIGLVATCSIIIAVPGPSIMLFISQVLMDGKNYALRGVAGNAIGMSIVAVLLAVGLGTIITESHITLLLIRALGAIALLWIGLQFLSSAGVTDSAKRTQTSRGKRPLVTGIVVGVTNPKAFIMFGTIVPSFLPRSIADPIITLVTYSFLPIILGLVIDSLWVVAAHALRSRILSTPNSIRNVSRAGGALIIITGLLLAWESISELCK